MTRRRQRQVLEAAAIASVLSGLPSTVHALLVGRSVPGAVRYVHDATAVIGVLLPPFRPGLIRGAAAHVLISLLAGEALARTVPRSHPVWLGAGAGLAMGALNCGLIGRRIPGVADLPLGPQLADNVAFGAIFGAVVDKLSDRQDGRRNWASNAGI